MKPILFFSHSSADRARAEVLVKDLEARGTFRTTFDVRDLRQGEEYAPQLFKWLARCHGGVLLLTQNVMLNAPWVLQEATVLRARSRLEGTSFRLFIVIDKEVLESRVWKRWFAPLKLDALQRLKVVDPAEPPDRIVDAICLGMDGVGGGSDDFFTRLALSLQEPLKPVVQNAAVTRTLAERLDEPDAAWQQLIGGAGALDGLLARRLCRGDFGTFGGMEGLFTAMQSLRKVPGVLDTLHGALRSYWVPLSNAAQIVDAQQLIQSLGGAATAGEPPANVLLLETDYQSAHLLVDMYVERHLAPYNAVPRIVNVGTGNQGLVPLRERVVQALRSLYSSNPSISAETLLQRRTVALKQGNHTVVHLAAPAALGELLAVAREFWPCLFIATCPRSSSAELAKRLGSPPITMPAGPRTDLEYLDDVDVASSIVEA